MSCKKCKCKVCSCIKNDVPKIAVNGIVQNQNENDVVNIKVPTKTSQLINDSGFGQGNGGGTGGQKIENIRVNGELVPIINKVAQISVPTKTSDIINDSDYTTKSYVDGEVGRVIDINTSGILGSINPSTNTSSLEDGVYRAEVEGTYPNASNIVVKEGYYTLLRKDNGVWKLESEVEMPTIQVANEVQQGNTNAVQSGAVYDELKPVKDVVDSVLVTTEGDVQKTTEEVVTNITPSSAYGYSFPIGKILLPFNKITFPFAQTSEAPVTEAEIRIFENSSTGALIVKKRKSFTPIGGARGDVVFELNEVISTNSELWCQVLVNEVFAVKRVSPAVKFTAENGYAPAKATRVNDLDGTTFATSQPNMDVLVIFNSVINYYVESGFTDYGKSKIEDIVNDVYGGSERKIDLVWNCVGHSVWWQDALLYSGTKILARGIQTHVREFFEFNGYNKYCYSGRSLGAQTPTGDTSSISNYFSTWIDTRQGFWTLDSIGNDYKRNIPIGTIADYNNATGVTTYYGALRAFKDRVDKLTPNAMIIVANYINRLNSTSANAQGHYITDYEQALLKVSQLNDWKFVDQKRFAGLFDDNLSICTLDGTHPNNFGYSIVANLWIDRLRNYLTLNSPHSKKCG